METGLNKALSWEIDNLCEIKDEINVPFSSGGCDWSLVYYLNQYCGCDHLALFLYAEHPDQSVRLGWKRRVRFRFAFSNQSGKQLSRAKRFNKTFCAEAPSWGVLRGLPLTKKLQEDGNKLTIHVHIQVLEIVHQGPSTKNDMLDYRGFQILASQAMSVSDIFSQHPGFAKDFIPKSQVVRTAFMNLLLGLIETLNKSPQSLSVTELSNPQSELDDLTEAGFKLDWLKSKLEDASLERKKALPDVQELEERVKNVESPIVAQHQGFAKDFIPKSQGVRTAYMNLLLGLIETLSRSPQSLSVTELRNAQSQLDVLTEAGFKLDMLKSKLGEVTLESKKAVSDGGSWVQQDLEERVKNVESTLSDLKDELDKEKIKSAARVTSFEFIDFFLKRFFLSCFSISKY